MFSPGDYVWAVHRSYPSYGRLGMIVGSTISSRKEVLIAVEERTCWWPINELKRVVVSFAGPAYAPRD